MEQRNLARRGIMEMSKYIPGKPVEEVKREYGLSDIIKLASNENPLRTSPKALAAMRAEIENVYMYPEGSSPDVRKALAERLGLGAESFLVGNGGDHVIHMICEAFVDEGDEVIVGDPSFITYETATDIMGGRLVRVALKNHVHDLPAMLSAVSEKTKLIFVCNPNNPTGTIVTKSAFEAFLNAVPTHCIVVLDEAYFDFVEQADYPDGTDYVKSGKNVIVIRTFSKVYGLAGLRVGYAITTPALMEPLLRVLPPFPVNRVAQAAAVAALTDEEFLSETLRVNAEGRAYLSRELEKLGMDVSPAYGNFVFVDTKLDAKALSGELLKRGVIIRPAGPWGYPTSARITVGSAAENARFIKSLAEIQAQLQ